MGRASLFLALAAFVALGGCVQTRQYANVEFTAPQGDYDLIVMRPVVEVGTVTAGGLVQPNAEWSQQARTQLVDALRRYETERGGRTVFLDNRAGLEGVPPETVASLERLFIAVGNSIILHRYMGAELPTKRGRGIDWTLGEDAVAFGQATGMEYALFLHAEDSIASTERTALQIVGIAGCAIGFCAPQQGRRAGGLCLARRPEDRRGRLVQYPADQQPAARRPLRRPEDGGRRRAAGRSPDRPDSRRPQRPGRGGGARPGPGAAMTHHFTRRALLAGLGCTCCAGLLPAAAAARVRPADMQPLVEPGYRPTEEDERGMWQQYERFEEEIAGSNLLIRDPALTSYVGGLIERVGGPAAQDLRIYLAQVPEFNAFMAPTGFVVVFSGLMTRMRDEAQLSGVIAHEAGHFLRRHPLRRWRDIKRRTDLYTLLAFGRGPRRRRHRRLSRRLGAARRHGNDADHGRLQPRARIGGGRDGGQAARRERLRSGGDAGGLAAADRRARRQRRDAPPQSPAAVPACHPSGAGNANGRPHPLGGGACRPIPVLRSRPRSLAGARSDRIASSCSTTRSS